MVPPELKVMGLLEVCYVRSEDNTSEINTKNLGGPLLNVHAMDIVGEDDSLWPNLFRFGP